MTNDTIESCFLEEQAKNRYASRLHAGENIPAHNEASRLLHEILKERDLYDGPFGYYESYPDGSIGCGDWGSFWYIEFRYRAIMIFEDEGADACRAYIRQELEGRNG